MNYRHAFHAGNFADCVKHAVLVWLLQAMRRKDTPFLVLDTHAGTGRYDLSSGEAERTGEWHHGIARLVHEPPARLAEYVALVERLGLYPGSPMIAQALLRDQDRLICCELHPVEHSALRAVTGRDPRIAVHLRDGYESLAGFLPPPERRALVLVDPPYEVEDEFCRLLVGLRTAISRLPSAVVMAWYPVKHRTPVRDFHDALRTSGLRDVVAAEFLLRAPLDAARLNGCGLLVVNPPWRFECEIPPILDALLDRLGSGEPGAGTSIVRLTDE